MLNPSCSGHGPYISKRAPDLLLEVQMVGYQWGLGWAMGRSLASDLFRVCG